MIQDIIMILGWYLLGFIGSFAYLIWLNVEFDTKADKEDLGIAIMFGLLGPVVCVTTCIFIIIHALGHKKPIFDIFFNTKDTHK